MEQPSSQALRQEGPPGEPRGQAKIAPPHDSLGERVRSLRLPSQAELEANRRGGWLWLVAGLLLASLLAGGWYFTVGPGRNSPPESTAAARPANQPAAPLPAAQAALGDVVLESKGYIIPAHQILVSPKVNGMIVKLDIEEGRRVKKGDVLAVLESTDYEADLDRAEGLLAAAKERLLELERGFRKDEIAQAEAELAEAKVVKDRAYDEFKRQRELRSNQATTEREYERADADYKAADRRVARLQFVLNLMQEGPRQERIAAAKAEVGQYAAEVAKARWRLDNCTIRAPISGTILKKNAEEGNIVNPIAFQGSYSLCDMADLADLEVDLYIQERDISRVTVGQKCKVRTDAWPDREYQGVVSRLMPIADRAKGAVPVRVKLAIPKAEEGVYLKPEMSAIVSFLKPARKP